jgi:hypothetical protein
LIANSAEDPETGCWVWTGARNRDGYGRINVYRHGRALPLLAHRVAYEVFKGDIPAEHDVDHKCKCRACINPAHHKLKHYYRHRLETGFPKANAPRGARCR